MVHPGVDTATADPRAARIARTRSLPEALREGRHVVWLNTSSRCRSTTCIALPRRVSPYLDVYRPTSESSSEDLCQFIGLE